MNLWIVLIVLGLLVLGSFAVAEISVVKAENSNKVLCSSCNNECNPEKNCGLSSCNAVNNQGTCGCGE